MIKLVRTNSKNLDFASLVEELDAYLAITDGDEHGFYHQFNSIENLDHVVLAYVENKAVGCGAFKEFNSNSVEVKRMYTLPEARGKGIATNILNELEDWARELNYKSTILETRKRQVEAVNFYKRCNYISIPKYGQYKVMENSLCFEKILKDEKR